MKMFKTEDLEAAVAEYVEDQKTTAARLRARGHTESANGIEQRAAAAQALLDATDACEMISGLLLKRLHPEVVNADGFTWNMEAVAALRH